MFESFLNDLDLGRTLMANYMKLLLCRHYQFAGFCIKPVHNKALRPSVRLRPRSGARTRDKGSLQISGRTHKPLCHQFEFRGSGVIPVTMQPLQQETFL
ncbi:inhibitor of growth protein [Plakobranchus ocellatus]|uniref:Inhibitor of growth protein n=1 Tax=Plakobranchus ocellatus TaxID=259542 RepID=A0AAV4BRU4_9GAST|nr:inhibitor of growth protein [Plakobranchus ocellatus]